MLFVKFVLVICAFPLLFIISAPAMSVAVLFVNVQLFIFVIPPSALIAPPSFAVLFVKFVFVIVSSLCLLVDIAAPLFAFVPGDPIPFALLFLKFELFIVAIVL